MVIFRCCCIWLGEDECTRKFVVWKSSPGRVGGSLTFLPFELFDCSEMDGDPDLDDDDG